VHGISTNSNGYAEWYTDTIKIRIPNPPTAAFAAASPICLFAPLAFDNQSNQGQVNAGTGVSYQWFFGDGAGSSVAFPTHTYTTAGTYNVQLIVNNGYCTDTLLKTQYIRALNAPKAGMVLQDSVACSPYNLRVAEVNTNPVSLRKYEMGDGQTLFPSSGNFTYQYQNPGLYRIIQTLESATGCVAKDTAILRLRKGFEPTDSAKMLNGTS